MKFLEDFFYSMCIWVIVKRLIYSNSVCSENNNGLNEVSHRNQVQCERYSNNSFIVFPL